MSKISSPMQLREALKQLFADAGYEREELLQLMDTYEELAADYAALLGENERLRQEAAARRPRPDAGESHMSSKLWDAIHE